MEKYFWTQFLYRQAKYRFMGLYYDLQTNDVAIYCQKANQGPKNHKTAK